MFQPWCLPGSDFIPRSHHSFVRFCLCVFCPDLRYIFLNDPFNVQSERCMGGLYIVYMYIPVPYIQYPKYKRTLAG